jgi:hypothetical protein
MTYCIYIEKKISRASIPISIKFVTNHPWVKEILNYSNKGPFPLQRGDHHKNTKMEWNHLNTFSRATESE